ncbi:MAG: excinuclease subunit, partial [Pedosphaera sp.]|nr:excinuclease subunit [Pedosphaera sp.]
MAVSAPIRKKLQELPHKPGIYLMKDRFGTVIYVGKARDLRKRVSSYFQPSRRMGWDLKFKALVEAIHDLDIHVVRSEPEALLLESRLIKEFHPRYNVSFRDDKQFLMLKVNLNDPIPRFVLTRFKQDDGARYFGPFAHSSALRNTLQLIRRQFHLRGCRPLTPNERDYKHCLYGNLKFCTAPCIANVTREQYLEQVKAACDFLSGQSEEMEAQLTEEMRKAALAQNYERAAMFRDAITDLRQTTFKTQKFERLPYTLPLAIEPQRDLAELGRVLNLPGPPLRIEGFDISNISGTFAVASLVSFKNGRPDRSNYRKFKMKSVVGQNDFACMAETIRRRYTRLLKEARQRKKEDGESKIEDGGEGLPNTAEASTTIDQVPGEQQNIPPLPGERAGVRAGETSDTSSDTKHETRNTEPPVPSNLPDLILIDGGKGQLSAACAELEKLGLGKIPIIGLAKEFEEIHRPGQSEPLRLSHDSGALKLLQRVRDESHRLANTYNAELRLRKISE